MREKKENPNLKRKKPGKKGSSESKTQQTTINNAWMHYQRTAIICPDDVSTDEFFTAGRCRHANLLKCCVLPPIV